MEESSRHRSFERSLEQSRGGRKDAVVSAMDGADWKDENKKKKMSERSHFAIQMVFAPPRNYVTTRITVQGLVSRGVFLAGFHVGGYLGYLRPRSRLYWPPYLQRFAASSVISGIQLANTAYTPTIIRCRQNRALAWVFCFISFFFFFFS